VPSTRPLVELPLALEYLPQVELAIEMGISRQTINAVETG